MSFLSSREQVAPKGIGKPVRRREDARLLTGAGRFADDMNLPGQAYAWVVRSPHAHARLAGIDIGPAADAPGVIAVLTGSDAARDGLQPIPHRPVPANPHEVPLKSRGGSLFFIAPHPVLAIGKVRHVGEPVAVVIAETLDQAMDAAERLAIVYDPLPAVARSADAFAPGAPPPWEEHRANLCVDSEAGDKEATDAAFARGAYRAAGDGDQPGHRRAEGIARRRRSLRRARGAIHRPYQCRRWRGFLCPVHQGDRGLLQCLRHPCSSMRGRAAVTNTAPTSACRSAGRPEVSLSSCA